MSNPDSINRFHVQLSQAGQNLRLIDASIQTAIVNAELAGDYEEAKELIALEAQLEVIRQQFPDPKASADDAILVESTKALIQLNKKMKSIVDSNKKTAALINDLSDLLTNSANLWDAVNKR